MLKLLDRVLDIIQYVLRDVKILIFKHFDKFFLAGLFSSGATIIVRFGNIPHVADWVEKGVVVGALIALVNKNQPPAGGDTTTHDGR